MPIFKNVSDMNNYILHKVIPQHLEKVANEVKGVLRNNLLNNWYKTYTPAYYERTNQLIDSIEVSPAKVIGNTVEVRIFFNSEKILPAPATTLGFFPSHSNITDGASDYAGRVYGELLPFWIEEGQHSSIYSATGIHMVRETIDWIKSDRYLVNRMKELLESKGFNIQ